MKQTVKDVIERYTGLQICEDSKKAKQRFKKPKQHPKKEEVRLLRLLRKLHLQGLCFQRAGEPGGLAAEFKN